MRLFVGLFLPQEIIAHLRQHRDSFGDPPPFRWTSDAALHITLKFIGEARIENMPIFSSVLDVLAAEQKSFKLYCEGGGFFPAGGHPRIFWTGIGGEIEPLKSLASQLETQFGALGFPPENRKFSPHLTLARMDQGGKVVQNFKKHFSSYRSPPFTVNFLHLIQSQLKPMGSDYVTVSSHEFGKIYSKAVFQGGHEG